MVDCRSRRSPGGSHFARKNIAFTRVLLPQEIDLSEFSRGGSLLARKNIAFTRVLLLQEHHNFSTVDGLRKEKELSKLNYLFYLRRPSTVEN